MKRMIATVRALSDEKRRHIEAEIRKSWASIKDGPEYEFWLARVRNKNRKVAVPIRDRLLDADVMFAADDFQHLFENAIRDEMISVIFLA